MEDNLTKVDDENFDRLVLGSSQPVVVDFWAPWCGPCKAVSPIIEKMAETHAEKVKFAKLNIDDNADTVKKYGIKSVPTILFFKQGQMVDKLVGMVTATKLEESLQNVLAGKPSASPFVVQ